MNQYETLFRISAAHFVAGLGVSIDSHVNWSAPILGYMVGWDLPRVRQHCAQKKWMIEEIGGYEWRLKHEKHRR